MGQSGNGTRFPHGSRVVYPPFFSNDDSPEYQLFKRYSDLILDLCDSVENEEQIVVVVKGQRVTLTTYINAVDENRSVGQSFTLGLMTLEPPPADSGAPNSSNQTKGQAKDFSSKQLLCQRFL
jgi:hypothetical protein